MGAILYNKPPEGTVYGAIVVSPENDIPSLVAALYTRFKFAREDIKVAPDMIDTGIASAYVHRFALDHGWQLYLDNTHPGTLDDNSLDEMLEGVSLSGPKRVTALVVVDNLALASRQPPAFALERLNLVREERRFHLAVAAPLDQAAKVTSREMPAEEWLAHTAKTENFDKELVAHADHVFVQHVTNRERLRNSLSTGEVTFQPAGARAEEPAFVLELNDVSTYPLNAA